ncbi:unnamed protein product [Diamesa serratosioi]
MFSDEVINRMKLKISAIDKIKHKDHFTYGIVQMDIKKNDETVRQIIINFENLTVTEPVEEILPDDVYADVLVLVNDEHLIDIACKEISIEDALLQKLLRIFGDKEIGRYLIKALKNCLEYEKFVPRPKPEPEEQDDDFFYRDDEDVYNDDGPQYIPSSSAEETSERSTNQRYGIEVLKRETILIILGFVLLNISHASILTNSIDISDVCLTKDLTNLSTKITCIKGDLKVDCVDEQNPGDKVIIKCKSGYEPSNNIHETERICLETGEWSSSEFECVAKCGYSSNGIPWNAPVYKNKKPICGGTIISEFIVLSAASCFVNETLDGIERLELNEFDVAVGKYLRDFEINEMAQFFKLQKIFIQSNYAGYKNQFDANYAVLTLDKPIRYTYSIFPICIDLSPIAVEQKTSPSNESQGIVAGFGYTHENGDPAYKLQQIDLPMITDENCKAKASKEYQKFIRSDKFCAGYATGNKGLCVGDDGGSIVFPHIVEGRRLYFIHGIASNLSSIYTKGSCDLDFYSLFTNVLHYTEEIAVENGKVIDSYYDEDEEELIERADVPIDITVVKVKCDPGYDMKSEDRERTIDCKSWGWNVPFPNCTKMCQVNDLLSHSTVAICKINSVKYRCPRSVEPGTKVSIECKPRYKLELIVQTDFECKKSGEWDGPTHNKCEADCGQVVKNSLALTYHGIDAKPHEIPWNVGIYRDDDQVCGGTIISELIVLSAAHCFKAELVKGISEVIKSKFKVVAGKYYRDINADEVGTTQTFNIIDVKIPEKYMGLAGSYQNDIAILTLDNMIVYEDHIAPACLNWNAQYSTEKDLPAEYTIGLVAGFGQTEDGKLSTHLKKLELPYVGFPTCKAMARDSLIPFLLGDKFCAGFSNNTGGVCKGDSGSGLAFKDIGTKKYHIFGIVSNTQGLNMTHCDPHMYSLFTNVMDHINMIKEQFIISMETLQDSIKNPKKIDSVL